ncbi:MAG: PDGLE domain-containing protein [Methanospirillaceae archaeon]|nr:PDGLE domain-containing protein [Methanospirillaceae archaeon]
MTLDNKTFILAGVIVAILIGVVAVFMASGDPDGLESSALVVSGQKDLAGLSPEEGDPEIVGTGTFAYESPLPDYSLPAMDGATGGLIAIVVGIILTLVVVIGATYLVVMGKGNSKA